MTAYLFDTSALARAHLPHVRARLGPLLAAGLLVTTPLLDLEALAAARDAAEHRRFAARRRALLRTVHPGPVTAARALDLHRHAGRLRVPARHVLLAALAEEHDLVVLHDDDAFTVLGDHCGSPAVRIAAPEGGAWLDTGGPPSRADGHEEDRAR